MRKAIISSALIYKLSGAGIRIYLGALIIILGLDLHKLVRFLLENKIVRSERFVNYFLSNLRDTSHILTLSLAAMLLIFSLLELIFIFALASKKRWGAIGLFAISIIWIPVEILFVSKFLFLSKTTAIVINLIIIYVLYKIIAENNINQK